LKENVIIGRLIPARYKTDEEMMPVPAEIQARLNEETDIEKEAALDTGIIEDEDAELIP
jgi:hypothetical protein